MLAVRQHSACFLDAVPEQPGQRLVRAGDNAGQTEVAHQRDGVQYTGRVDAVVLREYEPVEPRDVMPDSYSARLIKVQRAEVLVHLLSLVNLSLSAVHLDSNAQRFEPLVPDVSDSPHLAEGVLVLGVPKGLEVKHHKFLSHSCPHNNS